MNFLFRRCWYDDYIIYWFSYYNWILSIEGEEKDDDDDAVSNLKKMPNKNFTLPVLILADFRSLLYLSVLGQLCCISIFRLLFNKIARLVDWMWYFVRCIGTIVFSWFNTYRINTTPSSHGCFLFCINHSATVSVGWVVGCGMTSELWARLWYSHKK